MGNNWRELVEQLGELKPPQRPAQPIEGFDIKKEKYEYAVKRAELENRIAEAMLDSVSIPTQYQKKCWELAWEHGHSSGYHEVYNFLLELETIFV